jgi:hypothetical protein
MNNRGDQAKGGVIEIGSRPVTHYFIVTRLSGPAEDKEKGVRGPLSRDEFERLAVSNSLPRFTKTFKDLE